MTTQINWFSKMNPVLRVSTHIYEVSKDIDGKTFIFLVNLGHVIPQIDCFRKLSPVLRMSTHIYGFFVWR